MKPLFAPFLAFLVLGVLGATAAETAPAPGHPELRAIQRLQAGLPVRIVCFGDSITGAYYHTGGRRAWCDLVGLGLRRLYPHAQLEMINAGVGGNHTGDALRRMEADVFRHHPDLVLVMFGMNDVARLPATDFPANLRLITRRAQAAGAEVVLMTPTPAQPGDPSRLPAQVATLASVTRDLAPALRVPVIDTWRAFQAAQAADPRARYRLMSDAIHPNLRGHRLIAETTVLALTRQRIDLGELPPLEPGLPRLQARLRANQPIRIVAMRPYDTLIASALTRICPGARLTVVPWDADGRSLPEITLQAEALGWPRYRAHPELPTPDLCLIAVPATARAPDEAQFFRSYTWIMNWSLSFAPPGWDCLVILPSVAQPALDPAQRAAEALALDVIGGQDLPWLQRSSGDTATAEELLAHKLQTLLRPIAEPRKVEDAEVLRPNLDLRSSAVPRSP